MSDPNNVVNPNPTPAVSDTPATPAAATPAVSAQPGAPATPTPTPNPATTGAPQVPQGYVPSFRVRETREQYEARIQQLQAERQAEVDQLKRQIAALAGVNPPGQVDEAEAIRQQLFKVAPDLKELIDLKQQLMEIAKEKDEWRQQNQHYWQSYNRTQMDKLFKLASDGYGQQLTDPQKRYIAASFVGWAQSDPELVERYQTDPSLIDDFWKEFSSNFIEPARRVATTTAASRVAQNLPQDAPPGAVRTSAAPVEQPKDLDGRVDRAWEQFKQLRATKA